jgi:hypothetical protein
MPIESHPEYQEKKFIFTIPKLSALTHDEHMGKKSLIAGALMVVMFGGFFFFNNVRNARPARSATTRADRLAELRDNHRTSASQVSGTGSSTNSSTAGNIRRGQMAPWVDLDQVR